MSERFYPNIIEDQALLIRSIIRKLDEDEGYLTSPECPYSDELKKFFISFAKPSSNTLDVFEGDEIDALDDQLKKLINDLEEQGKALGSHDTSEKLHYFRTKTTLIEKLVTLRERTFNLKEIHVFRSTILQFMHDVCTPDQVTELMSKLDGVLSVD